MVALLPLLGLLAWPAAAATAPVPSPDWTWLLGGTPEPSAEGRLAGERFAAMKHQVKRRPVEPEVTPELVQTAISRGVAYLQKTQRRDGSWGVGYVTGPALDTDYVRVAVTGLVLDALEHNGGERGLIERGHRFVVDRGLADPDEVDTHGSNMNHRLYALAYGLRAALLPGAAEEDRKRNVQDFIFEIERMVGRTGGTEYNRSIVPGTPRYSAASFQLGMLVQSLQEAKRQGYKVPDFVLNSLLDEIQKSRGADATYPYRARTAQEGSLDGISRDPLLETLLIEAGRIKPGDNKELTRFSENSKDLLKVLDDEEAFHHEDTHYWAKYYVLFGYLNASEALLKRFPDGDKRDAIAKKFAAELLSIQQPDGRVVDSRWAAGPNYGTASFILALNNLQKALAQ
ncbi:MAG: hypothetical protein HYZ75_06315 [Elusimicrobia bacterium]|nr:hypothetical protein [Elusimicrobiota bacterium]